MIQHEAAVDYVKPPLTELCEQPNQYTYYSIEDPTREVPTPPLTELVGALAVRFDLHTNNPSEAPRVYSLLSEPPHLSRPLSEEEDLMSAKAVLAAYDVFFAGQDASQQSEGLQMFDTEARRRGCYVLNKYGCQLLGGLAAYKSGNIYSSKLFIKSSLPQEVRTIARNIMLTKREYQGKAPEHIQKMAAKLPKYDSDSFAAIGEETPFRIMAMSAPDRSDLCQHLGLELTIEPRVQIRLLPPLAAEARMHEQTRVAA